MILGLRLFVARLPSLTWAVSLVGTVLIAGACSRKAKPASTPSVPVTISAARRAPVPYVIEANGLVTPLRTAAVASQVDGIIAQVYFREGQDVTQGQLLFQVDPRSYQAAYKQSLANLARDRATAANALREAARYDTLVRQDYVTHEQADQQRATAEAAQATVSADEAAVASARFNLDNTTIRAPLSGRTGSLLVREGNLVHGNASMPLVVINQISPILVRFAVPATQLPLIQRFGATASLPVTAIPGGTPSESPSDTTAGGGQLVTATENDAPPANDSATTRTPAADRSASDDDAAAPREPLAGLAPVAAHGTLFFIDNAVDTTTGTVLLKASFPNTNKTLWAGQFVSTAVRLFVEQSALIVPSAAVVTGQQGTFVYVIDTASKASQRKVTVERTAGSIAVIASGLRDGDRVVTDGQARLTPGARVSINGGDGGGATAGAPTGRRSSRAAAR